MKENQLSRMTVAALKKLARGIRDVAKLKKAELIKAILAKKKSSKPETVAKSKSVSASKTSAAKPKKDTAKIKVAAEPVAPPKPRTRVRLPVLARPVAKSKPSVAAAKKSSAFAKTSPASSPPRARKSARSRPPAPVPMSPPAQQAEREDNAAHKFDLPPAAPQTFAPTPDENLGELPDSYGTQKLFLTARDPHWLYAYWDLTEQQKADARAQSRDNQLLLRLFDSVQLFPVQEIALHPSSRDWFLYVGRAGAAWRAQLGFNKHDGSFHVITESSRVITPRDTLAPETPLRFVTIPRELSLQELFALIRGHEGTEKKLADILYRLQMTGFAFPFKFTIVVGEWTPEQERALLELLGGEMLRRFRAGSLDFAEWLRGYLLEETSSGAVASAGKA